MSEKVYVDTEGLENGQSEVVDCIKTMQDYSAFMLDKVAAVNDIFDSTNYDRIVEALNGTVNAFERIYDRLEAAEQYLQKLSEHIEAYDRLRY